MTLNTENPGLLGSGDGVSRPNDGVLLPNDGVSRPNDGASLPIVEGKWVVAPCSSSSSFKESLKPLKRKLLLHKHEGEKLPNEGEKLPLVTLLTKAACFPSLAQQAIEAALRRGETPEEIEKSITDWLEYCNSPAGEGIKTPGVVTAKRLKAGIAPPELPEAEPEAEKPYFVEEDEIGRLYSDGKYR